MDAADAAGASHGPPRALVLGAGAQGLASALRLWEQGWDITVVARDWLSDTTSAGAGAIWEYPPFQVQPQDHARRWVLSTFASLLAAADVGCHRTGVRLRRSYYLFRSPAAASDAYALEEIRSVVRGFSEGPPPDGLAREGTFEYCFSYLAPVVNMRRYLSWLTAAVGGLPGTRCHSLALGDLAGVASLARSEGASLVVNCLGLGARRVFGDEALFGVRGDLVYVFAPGVEERYNLAHASDEDDPGGELTYVVAQGDGILALAGTSERVAVDQTEGGYRPQVGPAAAEVDRRILARNLQSLPGALRAQGAVPLADPIVVGRWSGLRPQREGGVRLELELSEAGEGGPLQVVHNYGHGGSGVVTSWGCAEDVAGLAARALADCPGPEHSGLRPRELPGSLAPLGAAAVAARLAGLAQSAVQPVARL